VAAAGLVNGAVGVGGQPGGELGDGLGEGAGDGTVAREGWGGEGADGEEGVGYGGGGAPEVGHPGLVGAGGGEGVRWGGEDGGGEGDANRSSIVSGWNGGGGRLTLPPRRSAHCRSVARTCCYELREGRERWTGGLEWRKK